MFWGPSTKITVSYESYPRVQKFIEPCPAKSPLLLFQSPSSAQGNVRPLVSVSENPTFSEMKVFHHALLTSIWLLELSGSALKSARCTSTNQNSAVTLRREMDRVQEEVVWMCWTHCCFLQVWKKNLEFQLSSTSSSYPCGAAVKKKPAPTLKKSLRFSLSGFLSAVRYPATWTGIYTQSTANI